MLLTKLSPLTFSHEVIANLVEQLNIYGTSIDKFRRMLKLMIVEFVWNSPHLDIHQALGSRYKKLIVVQKPGSETEEEAMRKVYSKIRTELKSKRPQAEIEGQIIPAVRDYV